MAATPTVLVTGISGNLGLSLLQQLAGFQTIGVDARDLPSGAQIFRFEKIDLAEERSCAQMLELMRSYRPEAVVHGAFVMDSPRGAGMGRQAMWQTNVVGTSRVIEAIAEHNRMVGGIEKFIFPGSAMVYGPEPKGLVQEEAALHAQSLPYALHAQEADMTVQARADTLRKCKTYLLRSPSHAGANARSCLLSALRGIPSGPARLGERLRRRGARLPLLLPRRGNHLEHRLQFVHVDDVARLCAHIARRRAADPQLNLLNVAGRGEALSLRRCIEIAGIPVKRLPARMMCRQALRLAWDLGVSDIPPQSLPYLLGSCVLETAKLRVFLGEHYRSVIQHSCEEALMDCFAADQMSAAPATSTIRA